VILPECWNGRQAAFRTPCPKGRGGSTPLRGTQEDVFEQMIEFTLSERYEVVKKQIQLLVGK